MVDALMIDAWTGEIARDVELPGYLKALFVAEPLHFGDYGGLPLKLLWSAFNLLTLFITANGAWLYFNRRRTQPRRPIQPTQPIQGRAMKGREPWLGLATIARLVVMLCAEGAVDVIGLSLALVPIAYAGLAWRRARRNRA